jgi:subtilisin family serine protease
MTSAARPHVYGRLIVRLRAGEASSRIQSFYDIRRGGGAPAISLGAGSVDRTIRRHANGMLVARAFTSAARLTRVGNAHYGYDDLEERLGFSRTFRVAVGPDVDVADLSNRLLDLDAVEMASPSYLSATPFSVRRHAAPAPDVYERIGALRARAMESPDPAVLIGLVDSGVALEHPELASALRAGVDTVALEQSSIPKGMQLVGNSSQMRQSSCEDRQGHGTACASILAARGLGMHAGLARGCSLIPARALAAVRRSDGSGLTALGSLLDIDIAVKLAVDLGGRVLNLSFGTPASALGPDDPIPHEDVIRYALERGCVLIAASGNNGDRDPFYPAALPGVIAVGALDVHGRPASFSSRGPHVALSAPGEGIPIAALSGYGVGNGTSFAAPFVTAAAALMLGRALRQATALDGESVRRLLVASAQPFARGVDAYGCGSGTLDVPAALRAVDAEVARIAADYDVEFADSARPSFQTTNPN